MSTCTRCPARRTRTALVALALAGVTSALVPAASAGAAPSSSSLPVGATLGPGDGLTSPSGQFSLLVTPDGQLVQQKAANRVSPTAYRQRLQAGAAGSRLVLQSDGNLVLYGPDGAVWGETGTVGLGAQRLVVQDDGNVVLYGAADRVVYDFNTDDPSTWDVGGSLLPGERLSSRDGETRLTMQLDGNLVLTSHGRVVWASGALSPGAAAVLQPDGNLVVYSVAGVAVFNTGSATSGPDETVGLSVDDGEVRVSESVGDSSEVLWGSAWTSSTLEPGHTLFVGDRRTAPGGVVLLMQGDGNLVEYVRGVPRFRTGTRAIFEGRLLMQPDGNAVVYDQLFAPGEQLRPLYSTRTAGHPGSRLVVQADGNVVVYTPTNQAVFASQR